MNAEEILAELQQHIGSELYYQHSLRKNLVYTDGVKCLAENAGAYWLLDAIASHQPEALKDPMLREIQFWTLKKREHEWLLFCERDTGDDIAIQQVIEFSDFPLDEIKLYVCRSAPDVWVILLPSEY